ncbi:MAG: Type fimbrial biosis protein PilY1 [Labilithrix sp.]|nr:Type fimbrial biosis protein PilY1 [Labilithrix sp.]
MRANYVRIAALLAGASFAAFVAACADDDQVDSGPGPAIDAGNDVTKIPDDASTPDVEPVDAGKNDASDADTTAEPTCSPENWCHTKLPEQVLLNDVWGDGQGAVWAVAEQGQIFRWDGKAWSIARPGTTTLNAIWGSSPTDVWVATETGLLHGTGATSNALTWTEIALDKPIKTVWGTSAGDVWAAGFVEIDYRTSDGRLYHFTGGAPNAPESWVVDPTASTAMGYAKVWGTSADDVWVGGAFGSGGAAAHRVADGSGGFTWRTEHSVSSYNLVGGDSITPSNVFLLGMGPPETYVTGESSDNGASFNWTTHDGFNTGYVLRDVWASSPNDIYVAGIQGRLRRFDGTKWNIVRIATQNVIPVTAELKAIWGTGPEDVWVVGEGIALHKSPVNQL